jgi:hypothetical protein
MEKLKKTECEKAIRSLCHKWAAANGINIGAVEQPSFLEFKQWLSSNGYSYLLGFRSVSGPVFDAELWFDQEMKQTWRN